MATIELKQARRVTVDEWRAEGARRFGTDQMQWRWKCPSCGHVASTQDYKDAGAKSSMVGFSCIGRSLPKCNEAFGGPGSGPCNYAGGGLIGLNPITVIVDGKEVAMFEFADGPARP